MARILKPDPVEFLVGRKFPDARKLRIPLPISPIARVSNADREFREKRLKEINEYEAELRALSQDELLSLFRTEQEKFQQELKAKAEEEERKHFFNQPFVDADFVHWSKAAYWTLEEAVALSFGKNPECVNWNKLNNYKSYPPSPFIEKYRKVRDLALRAKAVGQLYDPCLPSLFLAWARRCKINVPSELIEKIEEQGIVIADWKDMYDKLKEDCETFEALYRLTADELEQLKSTRNNQSAVTNSQYWQKLQQMAEKAISEFPEWKKKQRKVQKTNNLIDWLKNSIGADNREAEILKKIMSDIFEEL